MNDDSAPLDDTHTALTVTLSADGREALHYLTAKLYSPDEAVERALVLLASHFEAYLTHIGELRASGRDPEVATRNLRAIVQIVELQ